MKHKLHHKIISIVLGLAMVLTMLPIASVAVSAAEGDTENPVIDFSVLTSAYKITLGTDDSGTYYQVNGNSNVYYTGNITFTGKTTGCYISVTKGTYNVIFDDLYIEYTNGYSPFELYDLNTIVNLTLVGENTLTAGEKCAGLEVEWGKTLIIGGEGSLTATGGRNAAGIGGDFEDGYDSDCGTVIINSGVVTAKGGTEGAGIGGGSQGKGGNISINGGVVTANAGSNSAGIGGGYNGNGGNVIITGGTVIAKGGKFGIGGGDRWDNIRGTVEISGGNIQMSGTSGASNATLYNDNSENVSLNTITLNGVQAGTAVAEIKINAGTYGANDVQTIGDKLYIYLPSGTTPTQITLEDGTVYVPASNGGFYVQTYSPIADITSGSITLSQDGETKFYTQNDVAKIYTGIFTIAGNSAPSNTVTVASGTHDVVLDNLPMVGGITVQTNATANITLNGNNQLRGGLSNAGTVVITGSGALIETLDEYAILNQGTLTIAGAPTIQSMYGYAIRNEGTLSVTGNPVFKHKTGYAMLCYAGGTIDLSAVNCNGYTIRAVTEMAVSNILLPGEGYSLLDSDNLDVAAETVSSGNTVKVRDPKTNVIVEADIPELTYDGEDKVSFLKNLITVKMEDGTVLDPANYTLEISFFGNYADPVETVRDAGYYEMVVKISDHDTEYFGSETFSVYIEPKELTIVVGDIAINWGETMPELIYNVYDGYYYDKSELPAETYTGVMPEITLHTDGNSTSRDGTYKIKASALDEAGNYSIFYLNGTLTVNCLNHVFSEEGFCTSCDGYQNAVLCDNGTPDEEWDDYYEIRNAGQLYWFADFVNNVEGASSAKAKLINDIHVNSNHTFNNDGTYTGDGTPRTWVPIGTSADGSYLVYTGTFDGNEKTISGLYINNPNQNYVGLFGRIGYNPEIKDIHIANSYFSGNEYVGAIAGYAEVNLSTSSAASDVTVKGDSRVGGLIGSAGAYGDVYNCFSLANVDCTYGGGLVGYSSASIRNCYTTGENVAYSINSSYGGSFTNAYYLGETDDGYDGTTAVSAEQFASGEIAYLLQEGVAPVDVYDDDWNYIETVTPHIWGQNIDNDGEKQPYPVFNGAKVYKNQIGGCCDANAVYGYSNTEAEPVYAHVYVDNGICICGDYEVPTQDADGYYLIANAGNLYWFAQQVNGGDTSINGKLTADIVLPDPTDEEPSNWTPIGNQSNGFQGEVDGQGHTVANIQINTTEDYQGLFGYVLYGSVKNVGVIESNINGGEYVGGVCGYNSGAIINCYNTAMVRGSYIAGGVCGYNSGAITNCYNLGAVTGNALYVGGVCGYNSDGGTIENCYNTGMVNSSDSFGGVCGCNIGTITNCYYNNETFNGSAVGSDAGTIINTEGKTTKAFASGEVAYLLNNGVTDGTQAWYQTVGTGVPVLDSNAGTVYVIIACDGETVLNYNNTSGATGTHDYHNGICSICGAYEVPTQDENSYYLIANAGNLYWFAQQVNGGANSIKGKLIADIVLPDPAEEGTSNWTPIGKESIAFRGEFVGQDHTVANVQIYTTEDYQGLFGYVNKPGIVKNVGVIESNINGGQYVGGVCGDNSTGTITNCYNTGTVAGRNQVGGVCGYSNGTITNCYNTGTVTGSYNSVGGVCGYSNGTITNCYNTGTVTGSNKRAGGVCGYSTGTITNCYNIGTVTGKNNVGGVCGENYNGTITNCYYNNETFNDSAVGSDAGTITNTEGKTTEAFASGEVAYLLQGDQTEHIWGQKLGNDGEKQLYPVLGGPAVLYDESTNTYFNATPVEKFDISFASMTMANSLDMNFAFEKGHVDDWTGHYAVIRKTYADNRADVIQTVPLEAWKSTTINGIAHYYVTFTGIAAKEMTDEIYVTIYNADGEAVSNVWEDSVRALAMRTLALTDRADIELVQTMVVDMLYYGATAQQAFGYATDDLATSLLTEEQEGFATADTQYADNHVAGENYVASSLYLKSNIQLLLAFQNIDPSMHAIVTFTNHRGVAKTITIDGSEFTQNGSYYVVTVDDIVVADGRQDVTCKIYDGESVVAWVTDSMESYVARASTQDDAELYERIMKFSDSAYAYLHWDGVAET